MRIIFLFSGCILFSYCSIAQNVGIGIAAPLHKLHVINSTISINAIHATNTGTTNGTSWDQANNFSGVHGEAGAGTSQYQAGVYGYQIGSSINSGGVVGAYSANTWGGLGYTDANAVHWGVYTPVNLYAGGNVGIGTLTPLAKLHIVGSIRMVDGNQGINKIMVSDANGTGSWQTLAVGGLGGSGTLNSIPRFTPNGTTIGNSQITDNGTNVGINIAVPGAKLDVRTSATDIAVKGLSTANDGTGISGTCSAGTNAWGVYGESTTGYAGYFNGKVHVTDKIGIGVIPAYSLDVSGNLSYTGNFVNTATATDNSGVRGTCNVTPFYGYGVVGNGGYRGVEGAAILAGTGDRYGLYGRGANGAGNNFGMRSSASGGLNAYAVYGDAAGATYSNWAGFFGSGNVFVQNKLSVGVAVPAYAVDVTSNTSTYTGNFENTSINFGTGLRGACTTIAGAGIGVIGDGGSTGVSGFATLVGTGERFGVFGAGSNGAESNYGLRGQASAGLKAYGVYGKASGAQTNYGVFGESSSIPGEGLGVYGDGGFIGVSGYATAAGSGDRYGLYSLGANGAGSNFGVQGRAIGGTLAYGIYASALNGVVTWAGYFAGATFCTSGAWTGSDRKLKNDIKPLGDALSIINQLQPSVYTFKTTEYKQMNLPEGLQYGLIADEVQQVIPGAVKKAVQPAEYENHDPHKGKKLSDEVEFNAVNYTEMIPILIAGMKEQQIIIENLIKQQEQMKTEIAQLKANQK